MRNSVGGLQQGCAAPASPRPHPNPLPAVEGVDPRPGPFSVSPGGDPCVTWRAGFGKVARPPPPPALTPTLSQRERGPEGSALRARRAWRRVPSLRGDLCVTWRAGFGKVARPPPPPALTPTLSQRERGPEGSALRARRAWRRVPSLSLSQRERGLRECLGGLASGRLGRGCVRPGSVRRGSGCVCACGWSWG